MLPSRPVIFISAVSKELHSTRDLVAKTLLAMGYEPKWQDIAPTETGDLRAVLRKWVDESHAVLQIVGHRYGAAPKEPDPTFGPVSYTQYEALYAHAKGKKVWYIIIDEHHPTDPADPEPEDLKNLQAAYRLQVKAHHGLYHSSDAALSTENIVLRLRDDLAKLRRRGRQFATLILALLSLAIGGIVWNIFRQEKTTGDVATVKEQETRQTQELKLLRQAQADMRQMLESSIKGGSEEKLLQDYDAALRFIAARRGLSMAAFQSWLEQNATLALDDPSLSLKDKILAMQEAGQFIQARDFAIANADRLAAERQESKREEIELRIEASNSEITLGHYPAALEQSIKALQLADQKQDFPTWGKAKQQMGRALIVTGAYQAALALYEELVPLLEKSIGPEHPDTLFCRTGVAHALNFQRKYAEAEMQYRAVFAIQERVLGSEHQVTLEARYNLVGVQYGRSIKHSEAEAEYRAVLAILQRVLGLEHPTTLKARSTVATTLDSQGKYAEAEAEKCAVLAIQERVLGPEHPDTLGSRMSVASSLWYQGKHAEAEAKCRAVLAIQKRVLGSEHPDTLRSRMGVAGALPAQGKHADAEAEYRMVSAILQRALGPEHPETLSSRMGIANALYSQGKHAEAEAEHRAVLAIRERVLGTEHPETLSSCHNLSLTLEKLGQKEEALVLARRALAVRNKMLGENHSDSQDAKRQVEWLERE